MGQQGDIEEFSSAIPGGAGGTPLKLIAGPDGQIWFTTSGGRIVRMSMTGTVTGEFSARSGPEPGEPMVSRPDGLVVGANDDVWFTDTGTDSEGHAFIGRITLSYVVSEFELKTPGRIPGMIARDNDGNLWFTETTTVSGDSGAIGRISPSGTITEFKIPTEMFGFLTFDAPGAIALGADGNMWFTDEFSILSGAIGRITADGTFSGYRLEKEWVIPRAITLGSDGNIWFTEDEEQVGLITPDGVIRQFPVITTNRSPGGIALGPDGNIWFSEDETANAISRITPGGTVSEYTPISPGHGYPVAIGFGPDGNLWFGEQQGSKVGRLIMPRAPTNKVEPEVSGNAVRGQMLSVSTGDWAYEPESFKYQWQSCDATEGDCADIYGETGAEHYVTNTDVDRTLRAVVTATALGGSTSVLSTVSAVVVAPPSLAPVAMLPLSQLPGREPPVVGATMTWRFGWSLSFTLVRLLVVHAVPTAGSVEVSCRGRGCPFGRRQLTTQVRSARCRGRRCGSRLPAVSKRGELNLGALFKGRHLQVGDRISVSVLKSGWIGKSFVFTVRKNRPPIVEIGCLAAVSHDVGEGC